MYSFIISFSGPIHSHSLAGFGLALKSIDVSIAYAVSLIVVDSMYGTSFVVSRARSHYFLT